MLTPMTRARPFRLDEIDDRQVLLLERDRGVEQQHHHLGEPHGPQRIGDGELLQLVLDPRALAQARGVEQLDLAPVPDSSRGRWSRA